MESVKEILEANGLDFRIEKLPLSIVDVNHGVIDSDYYGLLNTKSGEVINSVKGTYHVTQNEEIVGNVMKGMEKFGNLSVKKAYSINGGRRVALQLGIEGQSTVNGDEIKRYVTIVDSNDGTSGLSVGVGDLTMSCKNQFNYFRKAGTIKSRHTSSIQETVNNLEFLIGNALTDSMKLVDLYRKFESTKVSRTIAHSLVNNILGFDKTSSKEELKGKSVKKMEEMYNNIDHQMNEKENNLWGLHSGITRYTTHDKSAPKRENGRIESLMVGSSYKMAMKSLEFCKYQLGDLV